MSKLATAMDVQDVKKRVTVVVLRSAVVARV